VSNALLLIGQCLLAMPKKKSCYKLSWANTRALYPISKSLNLTPISLQDQKDAIFNALFFGHPFDCFGNVQITIVTKQSLSWMLNIIIIPNPTMVKGLLDKNELQPCGVNRT
jgi:hypothetical protein